MNFSPSPIQFHNAPFTAALQFTASVHLNTAVKEKYTPCMDVLAFFSGARTESYLVHTVGCGFICRTL